MYQCTSDIACICQSISGIEVEDTQLKVTCIVVFDFIPYTVLLLA